MKIQKKETPAKLTGVSFIFGLICPIRTIATLIEKLVKPNSKS